LFKKELLISNDDDGQAKLIWSIRKAFLGSEQQNTSYVEYAHLITSTTITKHTGGTKSNWQAFIPVYHFQI
jgi:hypothetical protein